ncbi:MAG: LysR substrate-binding domain-containing protein [Actinomycetota bacterium]
MTTPTLRQLEYVVALADHAHFGRAAEAVHVSQPALSAQVRELEDRLGVVLFERDRRTTRPTDVGADVVERARTILRDVDDLVAATTAQDGVIRGRLRLGSIPTMAPYLLPAITGAIRRDWPEVTLELSEARTAALVESIQEGATDVGLLATPHDTGGLEVAELGDEEFVLTLPEHHELAGAGAVPIDVLADLPVLLLEEGHCLREHAMSVCSLAGAADHAEVRSASLATLSQMVAAGVGVTLLPASALPVEARDGSGLVTRPFEAPAPRRGIALVWRRSDPRSPHYEQLAASLRRVV